MLLRKPSPSISFGLGEYLLSDSVFMDNGSCEISILVTGEYVIGDYLLIKERNEQCKPGNLIENNKYAIQCLFGCTHSVIRRFFISLNYFHANSNLLMHALINKLHILIKNL